ncbi:TetR/AcrR family transcriptional regulator [Hoeflea sp. AS60]|uniref:TetR/AcrR family transcriptional regulator n=1 Tax=Hoeflea sp. AS60 TaxID=3135780 RepID=UPI00316D3F5C
MDTDFPDRTPAVEALLDAALAEFGTHGFAKTTMTDIAKASGLSRTALYNHFQTKEDVFRAISQRLNSEVYQAVMDAVHGRDGRDARLMAVMHARVSWVYQLLKASQFGRELIDEKNRICGGQVISANDQFSRIVATVIEEYPHLPDDADVLASLLIQSVNGVLEHAKNHDGAQASVHTLVTVFCRGLNSR